MLAIEHLFFFSLIMVCGVVTLQSMLLRSGGVLTKWMKGKLELLAVLTGLFHIFSSLNVIN